MFGRARNESSLDSLGSLAPRTTYSHFSEDIKGLLSHRSAYFLLIIQPKTSEPGFYVRIVASWRQEKEGHGTLWSLHVQKGFAQKLILA